MMHDWTQSSFRADLPKWQQWRVANTDQYVRHRSCALEFCHKLSPWTPGPLSLAMGSAPGPLSLAMGCACGATSLTMGCAPRPLNLELGSAPKPLSPSIGCAPVHPSLAMGCALLHLAVDASRIGSRQCSISAIGRGDGTVCWGPPQVPSKSGPIRGFGPWTDFGFRSMDRFWVLDQPKKRAN